MKFEALLKFGLMGLGILSGIYLFSSFIEKDDNELCQNLDDEVDKLLSKSLAKKLKKKEEEILEILKKSSDFNSELALQIEEKINSVKLIFKRKESHGFDIEICLEVIYDDETSISTKFYRKWDQIPSTIREKFVRTENSDVICSWQLPWHSSNLISEG